MTTPRPWDHRLREKALKLIFVARDRLVWDFSGRHDDIPVWDYVEWMVQGPEQDVAERTWACGCVSNNVTLTTTCPAHEGPVGTARNLNANDPRLNVTSAPTHVRLLFHTSQGGLGHTGALLSRDSLHKVMALIGTLDETPDPEDA